eukprot:gb/GECH01009688.1/.p1 GENE.gb/GECH01009688.1/~~gb/GECH01009688.1/.p1  ORF type:complete len:300 (+),score=100.43 gb/GECH01009688.1/:1-900(+)
MWESPTRNEWMSRINDQIERSQQSLETKFSRDINIHEVKENRVRSDKTLKSDKVQQQQVMGTFKKAKERFEYTQRNLRQHEEELRRLQEMIEKEQRDLDTYQYEINDCINRNSNLTSSISNNLQQLAETDNVLFSALNSDKSAFANLFGYMVTKQDFEAYKNRAPRLHFSSDSNNASPRISWTKSKTMRPPQKTLPAIPQSKKKTLPSVPSKSNSSSSLSSESSQYKYSQEKQQQQNRMNHHNQNHNHHWQHENPAEEAAQSSDYVVRRRSIQMNDLNESIRQGHHKLFSQKHFRNAKE